MKLEYQISQLGKGDRWHCNFCPFESKKNSIATHEMISYNTQSNGYNDIAYICAECKEDLDNGTLEYCDDCGRVLRNRVNCFCDLRKDEPVKNLSIAEIMGQSYVGRLEQQNKELKKQLVDVKLETSVHLEALETSKDWHKRQKQEFLNEINGLKTEVERLKKLTPPELIKEVENLKTELKQLSSITAQIEVKDKEVKKQHSWLRLRK